MYFAVRLGDMHVCPMVDFLIPHVGGPCTGPGNPTVLIGGMPAATSPGDMAVCVSPIPDMTAMGCQTVRIGGRAAVRTIVDTTAHGGRFVSGCPTVIIGSGGMMSAASIASNAASMVAAEAAAKAQRVAQRIKLELEKKELEIEQITAMDPVRIAWIETRIARIDERLESYNF